MLCGLPIGETRLVFVLDIRTKEPKLEVGTCLRLRSNTLNFGFSFSTQSSLSHLTLMLNVVFYSLFDDLICWVMTSIIYDAMDSLCPWWFIVLFYLMMIENLKCLWFIWFMFCKYYDLPWKVNLKYRFMFLGPTLIEAMKWWEQLWHGY